MKHLRSAIAGILALFVVSAAVAQTFPTIPDNSVIGRLGAGGSSGPSQAIPFATLGARIGSVAGPTTTVNGDVACWNNTIGSLLKDCGFSMPTSYAIGDILYASSGTVIGKLAGVAAGQPLVSGGVATAPLFAGTWATFDVANTRLVLRKDTNTFPVPSDTSSLTIFGPAGPAEARLNLIANQSDAVVFCARVNGTWASPTVVTAGQQICGWTGGSIQTNGDNAFQQGGYIAAYALNTWSPTDHSWYWDVGTIASGSTSLVNSARFSAAGGLSVGPTPGNAASGIINAVTGFTVAGAAATSGNVLRGDGTKFVSSALGASDVTNNGMLAVKATAVNFNSANSDTSITITLPTGYTRYQILRVLISHASQTLTTSTFGVFTAAAGGGTAIVASGTANTVSTASENTANNTMSATVAVGASGGTTSITTTPLFFRVQTAQGAPATADVTIVYTPIS